MSPKPSTAIDVSEDVAHEQAEVSQVSAVRASVPAATTPAAPLAPGTVSGAVPASEIVPPKPRPVASARSSAGPANADLAKLFAKFPPSRFKHLTAAEQEETTRLVPCHVLQDTSGTREMIKWYLKKNQIVMLPKWFAQENPTYIVIKE